jgi:hypothetical protein
MKAQNIIKKYVNKYSIVSNGDRNTNDKKNNEMRECGIYSTLKETRNICYARSI